VGCDWLQRYVRNDSAARDDPAEDYEELTVSTRNENHKHDVSTLASFSDWAAAIGTALAAFGWIQGNDTGQVVWTATVLTLTAVTSGGVYSYSSFTGPAPRVGMSVIFSGFATGGNNVTATLTAVSGGASGTVTVTATTQANETHAGSGTTTALAAAPTSGVYVYEIWKPGDGGTAFNVRFDYGNSGGTAPAIKVQIGTTTNGAGTLSGTTLTQILPNATANSGTVSTFNCLFAGSTNWFSMMMWRDIANAGNVMVAIERSHDSSGADTNSPTANAHVTLYACSSVWSHQSLVFGVGAAPISGNTVKQMTTLVAANGFGTYSNSFNGNIALSPVFPFLGFFDNPSIGIGTAASLDYTEGSVITTTLYSATHTFLFSKNQNFIGTQGQATGAGLLMRWE
jgi:hypothetical protein